MINGIEPNDQVRLEIDASDLTNLVSNHSAQTGNTTGWAADTNVTLSAVTNPTRAYSGTQTLQGTYTGGKTVAAAYGSTAAVLAETRSPSFPVTPGRWVGYQVSVGDPNIIDNSQPVFNVQHKINFYNSGGSFIGSSPVTTRRFSTSPQRPSQDNMPWNVRTFGATGQAPASAVTARVSLVMFDTSVVAGTQTRINRTVYVTKLMVVPGLSQQDTQNVPFTDAAVWQNVIGSSISVHTTRGGDVDGVLDDIEAGLLTAVVKDASLDPIKNTRATYGRRVRVTVSSNPGTSPFLPIFTGRVTSLDVDYASTKLQTAATYRPTITITATDAVAELSAVSAPYNYAGTFAEKVRALMALTTVPFLADSATASTVKTSVDENASLWDQLLLARNSFSTAKVFVDASGNLVGKSFSRNAPASDTAYGMIYASHAQTYTIYNWAKNPSGENSVGLGATTALSMAQSTAWAVQGTYSIKLTSTSTSGQKKFYPITRSTFGGADTYGRYVGLGIPVGSVGYAGACMTVKAIVACRVSLKVDNQAGANLGTVFADLAAGDVTTLKLNLAGGTVTSDHNAYLIVTQSGTNTDYNATGDLVYVDRIGVLEASIMTAAEAAAYGATDLYFDGSYVSPGIDGSPWWDNGTTHQTNSILQSGSAMSYNGYSAALGSKSLVNSLLINRRNSGELDGQRAYGPYLNPASISKWGTAGAEVTVVDGDPSTLATFYLAKYANPSVFVSELEVNAVEANAWNYRSYLTELYDTISFQNSVGAIYGTYYVIGIEQDITPDSWTLKLRTRPIDQLYALDVGVTNGSGAMSAGPLDVIGPNGRAQELPGSINLNNYTAPGAYAQTQNTEAASGLNYPVPQAGLLEVAMNADQSMVWQTYTVYNGGTYAGNVFSRTFYAGSWSAWQPSVDVVAYGISRLSASASLANNAWTTWAPWNSVEFKNAGSYSAGVWTMSIAGLYDIRFTFSFATNTTGLRGVRPFINGAAEVTQYMPPVSGQPTTVQVSLIKRLAVGDTLGAQAFQSSGAALNVLGDTLGIYTRAEFRRIMP